MLTFPAVRPQALRRQNLANKQNPAHLRNRSRVPPRRSPRREFGGGQRTARPTKRAKVGRVTPGAPLFRVPITRMIKESPYLRREIDCPMIRKKPILVSLIAC
jgi:hypothetical protein